MLAHAGDKRNLMLYEKREREGQRTPLADLPVIEDDDICWRAFIELHASRPGSETGYPIQFAELMSWMRLNKVSESEKRLVVRSVRKLDEVWLSHVRGKISEIADATKAND